MLLGCFIRSLVFIFGRCAMNYGACRRLFSYSVFLSNLKNKNV